MEINTQFKSYFNKFKEFFEKEKTHSVGVDVGGNNFKIVELEKKKNKIFLKNYALVKVEDKIVDEESGLIGDQVGKLLTKIFNEVDIKSKLVNTALPSSSSLITLIDIKNEGKGKEDYISQAVELEAPKYIPVDLDEVVYDWTVIDEDIKKPSEKKEEKLPGKKNDDNKPIEKNKAISSKKVLLVSVMKKIIKKFEKVFYDNDFEIDYLEVDCFPIQKALIRNNKRSYIILDVGGKLSSIIGIYKGNLIFNRNIDVAGDRLTDLISNAMGVGFNRAEKIKIEKGFKNDSPKIIENVIEPFFHKIVEQTEKAINEFSSFYRKEEIEAVILTGGTSQTKGLKEYLEKELELSVYYGNPWKSIEYPEKIENRLMSVGPYFSVAVGLALLGFENKRKN